MEDYDETYRGPACSVPDDNAEIAEDALNIIGDMLAEHPSMSPASLRGYALLRIRPLCPAWRCGTMAEFGEQMCEACWEHNRDLQSEWRDAPNPLVALAHDLVGVPRPTTDTATTPSPYSAREEALQSVAADAITWLDDADAEPELVAERVADLESRFNAAIADASHKPQAEAHGGETL